MRMSGKCRNNNSNNSDNPLTSRRTDGRKNHSIECASVAESHRGNTISSQLANY